jgi:predicted dehydrogenase
VSPVRIGCVGYGYWGPNIVRSVAKLPNAELVAICDASDANRAKAAAAYPGVATCSDPAELVARPDIDAVVIAAPAPLHYEIARKALDAGKHTFVEKPLTLTSADARDLLHRAEERGLTLMVGHLMEYHGAIEYLRDLVASGELGEILYVYAQRLNLGKVRTAENAFWSLAPHDVSMILFLLGEAPDRVSANGASYLHEGVQDVVFANLHFASGKTANIHVSWLDPHKTRRITLVGSKKMAVFDDMESTDKIWIYDKGVAPADAMAYGEDLMLRFGDIRVPHVKMAEPLVAEMKHFVECIESGATPRSDGLDGLRVVQVLEAVDASMRQGGAPIDISLEA